jgi:hypothetical protein
MRGTFGVLLIGGGVILIYLVIKNIASPGGTSSAPTTFVGQAPPSTTGQKAG